LIQVIESKYMLSVLIPIYNFDVTKLVEDIRNQCLECKITFEIICVDDGSSSKFLNLNESLTNISNVTYEILPQNIGRSKIRNYLAQKSSFDKLLFLDCDSEVVNENYIKNYLKHDAFHGVIYSGRAYHSNLPKDPAKILRWHYGVKREVVKAEFRNQKPYLSFMANNFLIDKSIFLNIKMDENLVGYGHEDTLFAEKLRLENYPILHIDNPLYHIGLEENIDFLRKTGEGVKNLAFLIKNKSISTNIKLYRYYQFLSKYKLVKLVEFILAKIDSTMTSNLLSNHPSLFYFDLYKLKHLIHYIKK
jgi:glycosyltransferase involved in cell wall biosynthesis